MGLALAAFLLCVVAVSALWGVNRGAAEDEEAVGRYQVGAPDLILDTATGRLVTASGQVLEPPIDAQGTQAGRYSVAGYVTAVTRAVGLDVINQPIARTDLVKGYAIADTETGKIVKQKVYHSQPIRAGEL